MCASGIILIVRQMMKQVRLLNVITQNGRHQQETRNVPDRKTSFFLLMVVIKS